MNFIKKYIKIKYKDGYPTVLYKHKMLFGILVWFRTHLPISKKIEYLTKAYNVLKTTQLKELQ